MSSITRDICIPTEFDVGKVREYWSLLKTWHEGVPEFLRLSGVTSECSDYAHKTSVLLTHCAYLGSIMLLTKRVLVERVKEAIEAVPSHVRKDMDEFSLMNISAARQLAQVISNSGKCSWLYSLL